MTPIFIIVGSPAVGKSTTSRALASRFSKSIHIPVDDIRTIVVSGLQMPSVEWNDALAQQVHLARMSAAQMALNYHQAQFAVVIDDFWSESLNFDYRALFEQGLVHKVVLYPTQDEAFARNLKRAGDSPARHYIDEGIRTVYAQLEAVMPQLQQENWLILDTTRLTVEETVSELMRTTGL